VERRCQSVDTLRSGPLLLASQKRCCYYWKKGDSSSSSLWRALVSHLVVAPSLAKARRRTTVVDILCEAEDPEVGKATSCVCLQVSPLQQEEEENCGVVRSRLNKKKKTPSVSWLMVGAIKDRELYGYRWGKHTATHGPPLHAPSVPIPPSLSLLYKIHLLLCVCVCVCLRLGKRRGSW